MNKIWQKCSLCKQDRVDLRSIKIAQAIVILIGLFYSFRLCNWNAIIMWFPSLDACVMYVHDIFPYQTNFKGIEYLCNWIDFDWNIFTIMLKMSHRTPVTFCTTQFPNRTDFWNAFRWLVMFIFMFFHFSHAFFNWVSTRVYFKVAYRLQLKIWDTTTTTATKTIE